MAPLSAFIPSSSDPSPFVPGFAWIVPFLFMLLAIAVLPLLVPRWWHSNLNRFKVAFCCGLPVLGLFASHGDWHTIGHTLHEYLSFLILLASLYTASGGIVLRGDLEATPKVNCAFLLTGALLASFMGTTGAAMLLIRPLLKTISERHYQVHTVVFFIFLVCNIGGCLTPLGDPPLFLGYLRGVPFTWTFSLLLPWAFVNATLLGVYWVLDTLLYKKESPSEHMHDRVEVKPLRIVGTTNFLWLALIVLSVAFLTPNNLSVWLDMHPHAFLPAYGRDLALVFAGAGAFIATPVDYRKANSFTWHPILEVAALFFGIFLSMMATVRLLEIHGPELGLNTPAQFFWLTGTLSAFLDNAPTYVVFFETAKSLGVEPNAVAVAGVNNELLVGISLGAVFMGAMTYIGNAPNFMIKSIAEENKIKMPSFFGYMFWSVLILIPLFFIVSLIFI